MTDWNKVSRIVNFCLSQLSTQDVIDAKVNAMKESVSGWYGIFEERNLADPAVHYEATLSKYAYRHYNEAIDIVANAQEKLIRETPAVLVGKLVFINQVEQSSVEGFTHWHNGVLIKLDPPETFIGVPIEGGFMNIYKVQVEVW